MWHIHDQHQKIFDAIEALSPEQRTADTDMELARACNNLADPETRDGRALLRRAIGLLEAHQAELQDTYSWNFRMGYAYYYLDQEGPALRYFIRALDLHPGDGPDVNTTEEVQSLISDCRERLALPWFQQQFRERAAAAWATFRQGEAGLLNLLGQVDAVILGFILNNVTPQNSAYGAHYKYGYSHYANRTQREMRDEN